MKPVIGVYLGWIPPEGKQWDQCIELPNLGRSLLKADLCSVLYRDEYDRVDSADSGVMEIIVAKNRNGSVSTCKVNFDAKVGMFSNIG